MLTTATLRKTLVWTALLSPCLLELPVALATPVITGVSAPNGLVNGQQLTITGSGFGAKSPAAPYLWADFEQGNLNPSPLGIDQAWANTPSASGSIGNMVYSATGGPNNGPYAQGIPQSGSGVSWAFFVHPPGQLDGRLGLHLERPQCQVLHLPENEEELRNREHHQL